MCKELLIQSLVKSEIDVKLSERELFLQTLQKIVFLDFRKPRGARRAGDAHEVAFMEREDNFAVRREDHIDFFPGVSH